MSKHVITAYIYDKRGKLISTAKNNYRKSHPVQAKFASIVGKDSNIYLHAEIAALLKCGIKEPHSIRIERFKKDGSSGLAMPCAICREALKFWSVKEVSYTL